MEPEIGDTVQGFDVYNSDEFKALCKRFNIAFDLRTVEITIRLSVYGAMVVTQSYQTEHTVIPNKVDTTDMHNVHFVTAEPVRAK